MYIFTLFFRIKKTLTFFEKRVSVFWGICFVILFVGWVEIVKQFLLFVVGETKCLNSPVLRTSPLTHLEGIYT
jgi:hypothetical protein